MKTLKKALALMLALTVVFAYTAVGAFAADEANGTITVNPNNKDQTYKLYKLFDAKGTDPVSYYLPEGKTLDTTGKQWFEVDSTTGVVSPKEGLAEDWAKNAEAVAWAKSFGTPVTGAEEITASQDNDPNVKWVNLPYGYYFVTSTLGSFVGISGAHPDATIQDKNEKPSLDKSITGVKDSAGENDGCVFDATEETEKADTGSGVNEQAIAQIGDTVSYKLTVTVKPGANNYVITDTMRNLKIVASSFKVGGAAIADNAKVDADGTSITDGGSTFTIKLAQSYLDGIEEETTVDITYDAKLDTSAAVADAANPNTAKLTYGTEPEKNYSEDSAKVWTAKVNVEKKKNDANGEPLPNAGFKLKKGDLFYDVDTNGNVVWNATGKEIMTGADGKLVEEFKGLANGTYTLVETTVPSGYNSLGDTTITIANNNASLDNLAQTATVINKSGSELPSTGGIGTTLFYVFGAILVVGAGILLIARRRMQASK